MQKNVPPVKDAPITLSGRTSARVLMTEVLSILRRDKPRPDASTTGHDADSAPTTERAAPARSEKG